VLVMMAALPVGSNALIFAQRYETLQAEATAAIVCRRWPSWARRRCGWPCWRWGG
jgi:hypothetical protein